MLEGESIYSSFIHHDEATNTFYAKYNDGRESWQIPVNAEKLRAFAELIDEITTKEQA